MYTLFKLLESTETIITTGHVTKDVIMRDIMQRNEYSRGSTNDIVILVDNSCSVTFANDMFYDFYNYHPQETINSFLGDICPELVSLVSKIAEGKRVVGKPVELVRGNGVREQYSADCSPINTNSRQFGALITIYKDKIRKEEKPADGNHARYTFDDLIGVSDNFCAAQTLCRADIRNLESYTHSRRVRHGQGTFRKCDPLHEPAQG